MSSKGYFGSPLGCLTMFITTLVLTIWIISILKIEMSGWIINTSIIGCALVSIVTTIFSFVKHGDDDIVVKAKVVEDKMLADEVLAAKLIKAKVAEAKAAEAKMVYINELGIQPKKPLEKLLMSHYKAGDTDSLIMMLQENLPNWKLSNKIIASARELCQLKKAIEISYSKGVSKVLVKNFEKDANSGATILWHLADRVAAFKTFDFPGSSGVGQMNTSPFTREIPFEQNLVNIGQKIDGLTKAAKESSETLVIWVISSAASTLDINSVENRLQSLTSAIVELNSIRL